MSLNREFPSAPLPGVLCAVVSNRQLLLIQRANEPDKGKWGLPGGMVEAGETLAQAAIRELFEETSLIASGGEVIDQFDLCSQNGRFHYALSVVRLDWLSGSPVAGSDAANVGWFSVQDIANLPCSQQLPRIAALVLP